MALAKQLKDTAGLSALAQPAAFRYTYISMDPQTRVRREEQPVNLDKPRQLSDFVESTLGVTETQIQLRKEELLRLLIAGKRTREAASVLGMSMATVRTYIKCPEFQKKLWAHDHKLWGRVDEELRQSKLTTTLRIAEMSEQALERLQELMESEDESIAFRASSDVLDRNPQTSKHSKEDRTEVKVEINAAQLQLAAVAAREMEARKSGVVLDGTTSKSE